MGEEDERRESARVTLDSLPSFKTRRDRKRSTYLQERERKHKRERERQKKERQRIREEQVERSKDELDMLLSDEEQNAISRRTKKHRPQARFEGEKEGLRRAWSDEEPDQSMKEDPDSEASEMSHKRKFCEEEGESEWERHRLRRKRQSIKQEQKSKDEEEKAREEESVSYQDLEDGEENVNVMDEDSEYEDVTDSKSKRKLEKQRQRKEKVKMLEDELLGELEMEYPPEETPSVAVEKLALPRKKRSSQSSQKRSQSPLDEGWPTENEIYVGVEKLRQIQKEGKVQAFLAEAERNQEVSYAEMKREIRLYIERKVQQKRLAEAKRQRQRRPPPKPRRRRRADWDGGWGEDDDDEDEEEEEDEDEDEEDEFNPDSEDSFSLQVAASAAKAKAQQRKNEAPRRRGRPRKNEAGLIDDESSYLQLPNVFGGDAIAAGAGRIRRGRNDKNPFPLSPSTALAGRFVEEYYDPDRQSVYGDELAATLSEDRYKLKENPSGCARTEPYAPIDPAEKAKYLHPGRDDARGLQLSLARKNVSAVLPSASKSSARMNRSVAPH